jgi:predicted transcriptional regulator
MFGLFRKKRGVEDLKVEIQDSFNHVKKDFNKVGEWIKHLDDNHDNHDNEIKLIKEQLLSIHGELMEMKDFVSFFGPHLSKQLTKQDQHRVVKQAESFSVQTPVQTPVQTDILNNLTVMERGIVWALLNSDMNLSYEDLAAVQGKDKSTIRGQINSIRQKTPGIVEEVREPNGKKRLYIPERIKTEIVKSVKIRVKKSKKD